jgi:hypothetical protein
VASDGDNPLWIKLTDSEWGVIDGGGFLVAELETEEECTECIQGMMDDPYWSTQGPFEIVSI